MKSDGAPHPPEAGRPEGSRHLYRGEIVDIRDTHCRRDRDDQAPRHQMWFVRSGAFVKGLGRQRLLGMPSDVFFFNHDEAYWLSLIHI